MAARPDTHVAIAGIAAAIGEPARARMLYALLDDRARTATELALVAGVGPSTASAHLNRLKAEGLVRVQVQGKHRFYRLDGPDVARALEGLGVLVGGFPAPFTPTTPKRLRAARTCYDHLAGSLGVALHDRMLERGWLEAATDGYELTAAGAVAMEGLGVDVAAVRKLRRRFAFACLDWSERRPHLGGGLAAALLGLAVERKWLVRERHGREVRTTINGARALREHFGLDAYRLEGSATRPHPGT